jgi:hypothetical protein
VWGRGPGSSQFCEDGLGDWSDGNNGAGINGAVCARLGLRRAMEYFARVTMEVGRDFHQMLSSLGGWKRDALWGKSGIWDWAFVSALVSTDSV